MTDPRQAAWQALQAVLLQGRSLDRALQEHVDTPLSPERRGLARALCFETLRWRWSLEAMRDALLDKPLKTRDQDLAVLMLLGLVQLERMNIPEHAVLNETVALAAGRRRPWARGLVNAILRRFLRERDALRARLVKNASALYSYPDWLLQRIRKDWPQHWQAIAEAGNAHAPMTLRVNHRQTTRELMLERLGAEGIEAVAGQAPMSLYLAEPMAVELLPGFAQGDVSVQDESAQWAAEWIGLQDGQRVLDACAAPGGKTAAMLEKADVDMLAIDNQADRVALIDAGLRRLGLSTAGRVRTACADAANPKTWHDGIVFDRILLDAPCSATGVIRRHPDIKSLRREDDIDRLAQLQHDMLRALWPLLARGGRLLYATCSICRRENHDQIKRFLDDVTDARLCDLPQTPATVVEPYGVQCLPGQGLPGECAPAVNTPDSNARVTGYGDGFFYALLEKH